MAQRDAARGRRDPRGSTKRVPRVGDSGGLGLGIALVAVALATGPLAELWVSPLLAHVRAAIRGELAPATAFVTLLVPLLVVGAAFAVLVTWQAASTRRPPDGERASRRRAPSEGEHASMRPSMATTSVAALLVVLMPLVLAARIWVFSLHAAAADLGPLVSALAVTLAWLCGGLGVALVVASVVTRRAAWASAGDDRRAAS